MQQQLLRAGGRDVLCGEGDRDGLLGGRELWQDCQVGGDIQDGRDHTAVQRVDGIQGVRTPLQLDTPEPVRTVRQRSTEEAQQRDGERSVATRLLAFPAAPLSNSVA